MINTKMMVGAVVVASALLAGCSKPMTDSAVESQLSQLAADVRAAKAEADRANQRLDNLTTGYRK